MARPAGDGRLTCESCQSIDVREWARWLSAPGSTVLMVVVTWW